MPKPLTVEHSAELLAHLFASWPELKKTQIRQWLKHQAVMVNGQPTSQFDHPLKPGDVVEVRTGKFAAPKTMLGGGMKVYFEDAAVIVVEKPSGLLSIASEAEQEKTAYRLLTDYVRHGNPTSKNRVWIVHRLDRETSGLMVFAKTAQAKEILQSTWDEAEKRYQAIVEGKFPTDKGTMESYLDESNPFKVFSIKAGPETRRAVTHYKVITRGSRLTLMELTLETGRRHQIRVQLAEMRYPIIGDEKYGARANPGRRLGLHSCALKFKHPVTRKMMEFTSPLPKELAKLVRP